MRLKTLRTLIACIVLLSGAGIANSRLTDGDRYSFDGLNYELKVNPWSYDLYSFRLVSIDDTVKNAVIPDSLTVESRSCAVREIALDRKCNIESLSIPSTIRKIQAHGGHYEEECLWPDSLKYVRISSLEKWMKIEFDTPYLTDTYGPYYGISNPIGKAAVMYVGDTPLTDLVIPEGTESVAHEAFYGAKFLKSVTFPSSLKSTGYGAFTGCDDLASIDVNSISFWCGLDFEPFTLSHATITASDWDDYLPVFSNKTKLREGGRGISYLAIPESVDTIRAGVFNNCRTIKSLYIPENVKALEAYCFVDCTGLEDVYMYSPQPPVAFSIVGFREDMWTVEDLYGFAFGWNNDRLDRPTLHVPLGSAEAYREDKYWGLFNNIEEFDPSGIEDIVAESPADYFRCGNGVISFENLPDGIVPEVYSIDGMLRHQGRSDTGVLPSGTYIIRLGRSSHKVHL